MDQPPRHGTAAHSRAHAFAVPAGPPSGNGVNWRYCLGPPQARFDRDPALAGEVGFALGDPGCGRRIRSALAGHSVLPGQAVAGR